MKRVLVLSLVSLSVVACASSPDDQAKPRFKPIAAGGEGGEYDSYGGEAGEEDWGGAAGDDGSDLGGAAGSDFGTGGSEPEPEPASTPNAPGCGANGNACCANGDTCADPKAQCCFECSGAPNYTCHCQNEYHSPGLCRVCCVVCSNGKGKADPLYVSGSSCGDAANAWCKEHFQVGADPKSGWRAQCG